MTYVLMADGFEEVEALTVVDMLRRADIAVSAVSINKDLIVNGAHNIKVICDMYVDDITLSDAIILPGGIPGVPNLASNEKVISAIKSHYSSGKLVAAICAAPTLLHNLGMLDNIKATCYPSMKDKLFKAKACDDRVVCENNIITSKGPGTAFEFSYEIIRYLKDQNIAEKVKNTAYFK